MNYVTVVWHMCSKQESLFLAKKEKGRESLSGESLGKVFLLPKRAGKAILDTKPGASFCGIIQ